MHVVDTTLFFAPHSGGVKRYLLAKQHHLRSIAGVRHSLVVPGACDGVEQTGIHRLASPRLPLGGGYRLPWRMHRWRDALAALEPDVIEAGDPYHIAWCALAAAERSGARAVAFVHSNLALMIRARIGRAASRIANLYLRRLYERFDLVLAPSRAVAADLRDAGIEGVEVQPLGVDIETFHPRQRGDDLRRRLGLEPETRLLVFAGRMAREKCIDRMCRAVVRLGPPYHLLLIGARERRRVSAFVTEWTYEQDARCLARLIAGADALLHAGEQETFGLVVLEAMACGLPVVGVSAGAVAELVDDAVGRLATSSAEAALCEAIQSLFEADLQALGAAARRRVEYGYSWPAVFAAQLDRYARLVRASADADAATTSEAVT